MQLKLELTDERFHDLERLRQSAELSSIGELISNAVTLFEIAAREIHSGRSIASVDEPHKIYREIILPAFGAIGKNPSPSKGL
jgi:hypothetical protein